MKTTLSLDDDVAALLERARRQRGGRSRDELGNELLRQTLTHLVTVIAAARHPDALEARIDHLYDEIRDLVARSADNPGLETEIEVKRDQLHALQEEEAEAWRQQAEERRHLKPGEGYRLLERADGSLAS